MKSFVEIKKPAAIAVAVIMIIASILVSGGSSLRSQRKEVENMFFNGVSNDGYSIQSDLDAKIEVANNLVTVAKRYYNSSDTMLLELIEARQELDGAVEVGEKRNASRKLDDAANSLIERMESDSTISMSDKDKKYCMSFKAELKSRNLTIENDRYNDYASRFNSTISTMPASIISTLTGVKKLELY